MRTNVTLRRLLPVLLLTLILVACGQGPTPAPPPAAPTPATPAPASAPAKLKIGMLPIIDALPFWVAEANGHFKAAGTDVELVTFRSADERDLALGAGQLDGVISDMVAAITLRASGAKVKVVSISLGATPAEGRFAILASPKSGITRLEQLKGVEVAISNNSVIHFVTHQLLMAAGFTADQIKTTSIPQIPIRFEALIGGQIKAATLPDPLLALAELEGALVLADDAKSPRNLSQSLILVTEAALTTKTDALQKFFVAYNKGVADIAKDPTRSLPVLVAKANLPKPIETTFKFVPFSPAQLPKDEEVKQVSTWLVDRKVIKQDVTFAELTDGRALPK